jgi:hypothetical protein
LGKLCFDIGPGETLATDGPARFSFRKKNGQRTRVVVDAQPETMVTKGKTEEESGDSDCHFPNRQL